MTIITNDDISINLDHVLCILRVREEDDFITVRFTNGDPLLFTLDSGEKLRKRMELAALPFLVRPFVQAFHKLSERLQHLFDGKFHLW